MIAGDGICDDLQNIANGYMRRAKLFRQQLQPQQL
jgi:hypothetical protein